MCVLRETNCWRILRNLGSVVTVSNVESMVGKTAAHDQLATEYTFKFNDVNVPLVD